MHSKELFYAMFLTLTHFQDPNSQDIAIYIKLQMIGATQCSKGQLSFYRSCKLQDTRYSNVHDNSTDMPINFKCSGKNRNLYEFPVTRRIALRGAGKTFVLDSNMAQ
jgi:hypothetical protein